jgi:transposase
VGKLTTVGIDLAKDVIAVCVLDVHGAVIERRVLRRAAFERWAEQLPASTVAMEACGSAHHWGRWFAARGHSARLIAAEFVVPFRKGGKNDTADAEAIAIAARQPTMRFVPIKTVDQQAILAWHSVREGWKEERTALLNRVRGLLAEYGVVIGRSADRFLTALPKLSEDSRLPDPVRAMLFEAREQFASLHARLARCDAQIAAHARNSPTAQRAGELLGVAPSRRVHWPRRFPMPGSSRAAASLPPGSASRLDSTAPAARLDWDGLACVATSIYARC